MKADTTDTYTELFTPEKLRALFPAERADRFFDALLGDPKEGAYDIRLAYEGFRAGQLHFALELHQRPRKCLACNLTYGLPVVFSRHPIIDIQGLVDQIALLLNDRGRCTGWKLGATREQSRQLHVVPLLIDVALS
ncbi:MAG: pancreas/duodenum homeobox protein 1 [Desulfatitalea sp.]